VVIASRFCRGTRSKGSSYSCAATPALKVLPYVVGALGIGCCGMNIQTEQTKPIISIKTIGYRLEKRLGSAEFRFVFCLCDRIGFVKGYFRITVVWGEASTKCADVLSGSEVRLHYPVKDVLSFAAPEARRGR